MKLRTKGIICILILVASSGNSFALNQNWSIGILHHRTLSGEIKLKGLYRQQKSLFNDVGDDQQSTYFMGGIRVHSGSYLWRPDIVSLDIDAEVNPEIRDEKFLVIPDRSEIMTLNKISVKMTVFNNKPLTLSSFVNLHQGYFNREILTDVKSINRQWGGLASFNNKYLPFSVTFRQTKWDQDEVQTGRSFKMDQSNLQGRINKSFGSNDKHELIYSHDEYKYQYADLHAVINRIDRISLSNNLFFDAEKNYNFASLISYSNQEGDIEFKRIEALERLVFRLPGNLKFTGNYDYYNLQSRSQTTVQNRIRSSLNHKLFLSLTTNLFFSYSNINRTLNSDSRESNTRAGIEFNYTKKIPLGRINLSYRYFRQHQSMDSKTSTIQIFNEEHVLSDGEIVLLDKPYINTLTIVVRDLTSTITYQPEFDYILIERNNFVEIQRVPGGLIANHETVLVDYAAIQPGSYEYDANNNNFSVNLLLFKRILELYYRTSTQDYTNLRQTDLLTLNYYSQNVYGCRIDLGFARGGIEFDDYNSNIIPYKMMRYYLDINGNIGRKLLLSLNGSVRDYIMIDYDEDQLYTNISGRMAYHIKSQMKVNLEFGYLNQKGHNIDLDALTARAEFIASFRQITMKAGLELYRRFYVNSSYTLNGAYLQIARKF